MTTTINDNNSKHSEMNIKQGILHILDSLDEYPNLQRDLSAHQSSKTTSFIYLLVIINIIYIYSPEKIFFTLSA